MINSSQYKVLHPKSSMQWGRGRGSNPPILHTVFHGQAAVTSGALRKNWENKALPSLAKLRQLMVKQLIIVNFKGKHSYM